MPLRIETRFKRAVEFGGNSDELWVRAYPDDISVDAFEDTLSQDETKRARNYRADIWRAGGMVADERGAWRVFLSGQGSGRSYWITQTYRPLNEAARPVKPDGIPTVILTIATQTPLADPERTTVSDFWTALWKAGDDAAAQTAAANALIAALGQDRATAVRDAYRPRNLDDSPPANATRAQTTVVVAYLEFPSDDAIGVRQNGWSQAAAARNLPDRLVLLGYNGGALKVEQLGNPIPSPLAVTPSPVDGDEASVAADGADIKFGAELSWLTDFNRAIEVGMGFRVPVCACFPARLRHADGAWRALVGRC